MEEITEQKIEELAGMIVYTDWYYNYSDDYGVWQRGRDEVNFVNKTFKEIVLSESDIENLKLKVLEKLQKTHSYGGVIRKESYNYFMEKFSHLVESKV
jgi:hypothetical protein